jgi:hypothetical protein
MPFLRTFIAHPLERQPDVLVRSRPGMPIEAKTLGEAIAIAAGYFGVRITLHDERDWFRIYGMPEDKRNYTLVGITIYRGKEWISLNQDLSFPLLESDCVGISVLTD